MVFANQMAKKDLAPPPPRVSLGTDDDETLIDSQEDAAETDADADDGEQQDDDKNNCDDNNYVFNGSAPTNARPTGFVLMTWTSSESNNNKLPEVAWFIVDPSNCSKMDEFPSTHSAVVQMTTNLLPSAPSAANKNSNNNLNVDDLFEHVFRPMSECHQKFMKRQCRQSFILAFLFYGLFSVLLFAMLKALNYYWTDAVTNHHPWIVLLTTVGWAVVYVVGGIYVHLRYCPPDWYGKKICSIVESYQSPAMERGIDMRFLWNHVGPVDPARPENNRYQGMAIVVRRCHNKPAPIEESPSGCSAANEEEQKYIVDHWDQDSISLTVTASSQSSSSSQSADAEQPQPSSPSSSFSFFFSIQSNVITGMKVSAGC